MLPDHSVTDVPGLYRAAASRALQPTGATRIIMRGWMASPARRALRAWTRETSAAELCVIPQQPSMRRLAVFDVDGTLTDTNAVDDECYRDVIAESLGLDAHSLDWSAAPHMTDSGLLRWLAERHAVPLEASHEPAVLARFIELLKRQLAANPARFQPIRGAVTVRAELERRGWQVALATGGWEPSARLKLNAVGFDLREIALASASDALTRMDIVQCARRRATDRFGTFDRVVSVGDAVWDVRTATAVGWPFVGIATGARADQLTSHGVSTILADLADINAVLAALEAATLPKIAMVTPVS